MKATAMLALGLTISYVSLFAQGNGTVIKVKKGYAVINQGARDGVQAGDRFEIYSKQNPDDHGLVEV